MDAIIIVYPIRTSQPWQKWKSLPSSTHSSARRTHSSRPPYAAQPLMCRPPDAPKAPRPHRPNLPSPKSHTPPWEGSPTLQNPRLPRRAASGKILLFQSGTRRSRKFAPKTNKPSKKPSLSSKHSRMPLSKTRTHRTPMLRMVYHLPRSIRWLAGPRIPTCFSANHMSTKSINTTCSRTPCRPTQPDPPAPCSTISSSPGPSMTPT